MDIFSRLAHRSASFVGTLALAADALTAASDERPLPFQPDDYPQALAQARARERPLFIEAWAPW